jgi:DNA polymerase-3 subunit beta
MMKVGRAELIRALEIALAPAELEHEKHPQVAFFAAPGGIQLRGQTEDTAGWDVVPCAGALESPFLIPGRPVLQTLKEIRTEYVELLPETAELHLLAGGYRAVLWIRPTSASVEILTTAELEMSSNLVGQLGAMVAYARPKGRNRSVFPGVHLVLGPDGLRVVATDGRRLAMASADTVRADSEMSSILPGRFLLLASQFLDLDAPTRLTIGPATVAVHQEGRGVSATILTGHMPSYKALLPGPAQNIGRLRRSRFIEALRQARLFSGRVLVQLDEDKLYLSTPQSPEGQAEITLGVEWAGPLYRAQLNTEELLEALENLSGEELLLEVQGERVPVVLRGESTAVATLMPLLG